MRPAGWPEDPRWIRATVASTREVYRGIPLGSAPASSRADGPPIPAPPIPAFPSPSEGLHYLAWTDDTFWVPRSRRARRFVPPRSPVPTTPFELLGRASAAGAGTISAPTAR